MSSPEKKAAVGKRISRRTQAASGARKRTAAPPMFPTHRYFDVDQGMREPGVDLVDFFPKDNLQTVALKVLRATPMQRVVLEKQGVRGGLLKHLALQMAIPAGRLYDIVGIPKATAEKKASTDSVISGAGGQATLGMVRLLGMAQEIVEKSTAIDAARFDVARWLGEWIECPQPALNGKRPADILDTPTGVEIVARTLGALESGSFQ